MPLTKGKAKQVLGHTIVEPRLTYKAYWLLFVYLLLPVLVLGSLADLIMQGLFGLCTGLWCIL